MNLLVTNTHHIQAYAIICALRPYSAKVVATLYGDNRLKANFAHAARSRLVDQRYYVPSPIKDWQAGRISAENTEQEEAYIRAIEEICDREHIDTIFPSFDAHVYLFSKNKARFAKKGVLIPVPDYETVLVPLDKYRTVLAAQSVGFPCPRTCLAESDDDLKEIDRDWQYPVMIRPRFTSSAQGVEIVNNFKALVEKTRVVRATWGTPMIQEYIPGRDLTAHSFRMVIDREGQLIACFCTKVLRTVVRLRRSWVAAFQLEAPGAYLEPAVRLLREIGWWGAASVSMKLDPRDGVPKLTEINCRFGSRLWHATEVGVNLPLICLKIARGEKVQRVDGYSAGAVLLDPVADVFQCCFWALDYPLYSLRTRVLKLTPFDPLKAPMRPAQVLDSYRKTYFGGERKVYTPYFKYFFRDPMVSALEWISYVHQFFQHARELGR